MSWSNKSGSRRSILKRRSDTKERVVAFAQRAGILIAITAGIVWLGAWFTLSGASTAFSDWAQSKTLAKSAQAGYRVANIYIEGRQHTDAQSLRAIINVQKGDPLFAFDIEQAQGLIERLSWVKSAEVKRQLPDTLYVSLVERQPYALWQRKGRLSVVDEEGVVLSDSRAPEFAHLIVLTGEEAPAKAKDLLTMLQAEPDIYASVEGAALISNRRWDVTLKNGIVVKLPEDDLGLALGQLAKAQAEDDLLEKDIAAVDLREPDRLVVETKPGAVNDYLNGVAPAAGEGI